MGFNEAKEKISKLFRGREGFSDEIFDAMAASYVYFEQNFPEPIEDKEIFDANTFTIDSKTGKRTLANIYLNRIFNNVTKIEYTQNDSEYISDDKKVLVLTNIDNRLRIWADDIKNGHEEVIKKNIRAKIIVHELIHAASDNGLFVGFLSKPSSTTKIGLLGNQNKEKYANLNASSSRLEEAITEILALNIVGTNILSVSSSQSGFVICRNPDSSNHNLNCFAEYFARIYPDCLIGKFTDAFAWCNKFEKEHANVGVFHMQPINNNLRAIAEGKIAVAKGLAEYQELMLLDYLQNIKAESKDDVKKMISDYAAFEIFSAKDMNGQKFDTLNARLNELKNEIISAAKRCGIEKSELNETMIEENRKLKSISGDNQREYTEPYEALKQPAKSKMI